MFFDNFISYCLIYFMTAEAAAKREAQMQAKKEGDASKQEAAAKKQAFEEERKRNAEARKQVEFDRYQRQMEIDKKKQQQTSDLKKSVAPPSKKEVQSSPARPTFSLFGMGGSPESKEESAPTITVTPPTRKDPATPRGVPSINKWTLNDDNTISGFISGSPSFIDGSPITTSAISGNAVSGSVVQTKSRSKYFLGEAAAGASSGGGGLLGGLFGGGGGEKATAPAEVKPAPVVKKSAPAKQVDTGAANRKRIAEQAALEKKRKTEEAKAAAEAKRQAQLQAKKEADEKRRITAEGKLYMIWLQIRHVMSGWLFAHVSLCAIPFMFYTV